MLGPTVVVPMEGLTGHRQEKKEGKGRSKSSKTFAAFQTHGPSSIRNYPFPCQSEKGSPFISL